MKTIKNTHNIYWRSLSNSSLPGIVVFVTVFLITDFHRCCCSTITSDISAAIFQTVIDDYGSNGSLTFANLEHFVSRKDSISTKLLNHSGKLENCLTPHENVSSERDCLVDCASLRNVFESYKHAGTNSTINTTSLQSLSPVLLYLVKYNCFGNHSNHRERGEQGHVPPSAGQVWGYGFLMVTVINLCSLVGVIALPFMKMAAFKEILVFMVALAVGALAGSGLLFLIPEAFGLVKEDDDNIDYIFKASTVMGGIYLFYLTEKVMRILTHWKERRNMKRRNMRDNGSDDDVMSIVCSVKKNMPLNHERMYKEPSTFPATSSTVSTEQELIDKSSDGSDYTNDKQLASGRDGSGEIYDEKNSNKQGEEEPGVKVVKPLAWMIIFGDGLHNFIDGLSIGTAFTQSVLAGISVSVAVMCEELPHELGDFAILLNCGMTVRRALLYNFLSACMCYFGLVIGTLLGENMSSHDWVFAIAGGMFLYISLADMVPEMNSASEVVDSRHAKQIFVLQNLGLFVGFGVMLLMAVYGRYITFE